MTKQTGSIDLKAQKAAHDEAAQTATNYIFKTTGHDAWVCDENAGPNESTGEAYGPSATNPTTGWRIGSVFELVKQGVSWFKLWVENGVAKLRLGNSDSGHLLLDPDGVSVVDDSNVVARFSDETFVGEKAGKHVEITSAGMSVMNAAHRMMFAGLDRSMAGVMVGELDGSPLPVRGPIGYADYPLIGDDTWDDLYWKIDYFEDAQYGDAEAIYYSENGTSYYHKFTYYFDTGTLTDEDTHVQRTAKRNFEEAETSEGVVTWYYSLDASNFEIVIQNDVATSNRKSNALVSLLSEVTDTVVDATLEFGGDNPGPLAPWTFSNYVTPSMYSQDEPDELAFKSGSYTPLIVYPRGVLMDYAYVNHDALVMGSMGVNGSVRSKAYTVAADSNNTASLNFASENRDAAFLKLYGASDANGDAIVIGDGGRVIIGGGESAQNLYDWLANLGQAPGSEDLQLAADTNIYLYSRCDTVANRARAMFHVDTDSSSGSYLAHFHSIDAALNNPAAIDTSSDNGVSASTYLACVNLRDKEGTWAGRVAARTGASGEIVSLIGARNKKTDGTTVTNYINVIAKKDGSQTYGVSSPTNFRSAIGSLARVPGSTAELPRCTATSNVFPIVLGNTFANNGEISYMRADEFTTMLGFGEVKTASSASVSAASASNVNLRSISLTAGVWLVCGRAQWPNNTTGRRAAKLSTTSGDTTNCVSTTSIAPVSGATTQLSVTRYFKLTATTTVYLVGYHNIGSAQTCYGEIEAVRIG